MITKTPNEIFCNLAIAVADALECSETPTSLKDALNEVGSSLIDQFSGEKIAPQLRALASIAQSEDGIASPAVKAFAVASPGAKSGA
jgi:hypothetical protein